MAAEAFTRDLAGYKPLIILVGSEWITNHDPELKSIYDALKEIGAEIVHLESDEYNSAAVAQVSRLFASLAPQV